MAVTGIVGVLFVIGHMVGNLQVFQGAERLNAYGRLLHGPLNELIWGARAVLLVARGAARGGGVAAHDAQPGGAARARTRSGTPQVSTLASRTLRWGGVLLLAFIVYHLARPHHRHGQPGVRRRRRRTTTCSGRCSAR